MTEPRFSFRRKAAVAGQFYPAEPERLRTMLAHFLDSRPPSPPGEVRALIVPHAGYPCSGATAGEAYALLRGRTGLRRAVLVAPAHRLSFRGLSLGNYSALCTPLGEVAVDTALCAELAAAHPLFSCRMDAHADEHALEVQLPFLQMVQPRLPVVPLVCGDLDVGELRTLGRAVAPLLWNPETLWIISSDFTHFGEAFGYVPFRRDVSRRVEELDSGAIERIRSLDLDGFWDYLARTGATICGHVPIGLLLATLEPQRDRLAGRMLAYTTSSRLTHDEEHSVSYAALAIHEAGCPAAAGAPAAEAGPAGGLTSAARAVLLQLARDAIATGAARHRAPDPDPATLPAELRAVGAAFVTLRRNGVLRGCIGSLEATEPLYQDVMRNARNAAFHDPRFLPLAADELATLELEISVLTPPRPIESPAEFVLGRHGIILEKGGAGAVFLPQVAPEQGWDKETTLAHLAAKAGLKPNAWRRGATFHVFEAIVFGDGA